ENKRNNKAIIVPIIIFFVFLFALIGYKQLMGVNFSFLSAIYSTLFFFILNNVDPYEAGNNAWLLLSRYLAALTLGLGIYNLLYSHFYRQYTILKIKLGYSNHVIVFSMKMVGANFFSDLLANKYKVILVEKGPENSGIKKLEKDGVIVFREEVLDSKLFS